MSEEMAVNDNAPREDVKANKDEDVDLQAGSEEGDEAISKSLTETPAQKSEEIPEAEKQEVKVESKDDQPSEDANMKIKTEDNDILISATPIESSLPIDDKRGIKRRASTALSDIDESEEFKGFEKIEESSLEDYSKVVERLEAEVKAAVKSITPLRTVRASSITTLRASKRSRQDTDGSRPSSALSSRSDGDGTGSTDASMSPVGGGKGRRATVEMSSPLLRVPLERGWRRELVYRATADPHSRRMADIYYYTPAGKKLRSSREISDHLSGSGLTLENFSFFKEPLGIDDPEKEIIRDAKVIRRAESPVPVAAVEGKRTPKPKPPKGASPDPPALKSPPAKLKVKSMGSRLSSNVTTPTAVTPKQLRKQPQQSPATPTATAAATAATAPTTTVTPAATVTATANATATATAAATDNNNTPAWKKPRPTPPALQSRPQLPPPPTATIQEPARQLVQPCSMTCGRGVPSLACVACLCLYHPACVGFAHIVRDKFYCKNCRKSASPPVEPPPLTHKSGLSASQQPPAPPAPAAPPAAAAPPVPPRRLVVPVPVPAKVAKGDKRVTLRMKVAGGGPDGSRLWAVTKGPTNAPSSSTTPPAPQQPSAPSPALAPASAPAPAPTSVPAPPRPSLPQSLAVLNGRRFIIVPRSLVHATNI